MNEISVVSDGALLIHNGVIQESGPSRRIENLQHAKNAREIDAQGKLVMPAFVDPDAVLVLPPASEVALKVVSRKRLEVQAMSAAAGYARCGTLNLAAHTGYASNLRETVKALLIHKALQNKPLRIRSIFSPRGAAVANPAAIKELIEKWLPAGRKRKLASILELTAPVSPEFREIAIAGASLGYTLRIRSDEPLYDAGNELALAGGAVAIVAPAASAVTHTRRLSELGCVHVLRAAAALTTDEPLAAQTRVQLEEGAALALGSGYAPRGYTSFNPQFLMHLAVTRLGFTPEEAICAMTWNAACSLRLSHVTGSLEPGKGADLLLMDVSDYRELSRRAGHSDVIFAMRAGRIVWKRAPLNLD